LKLGLTGGIGCGKSTVVGLFAQRGWRTVQSDALVRDLLAEDVDLHCEIIERWGQSIKSSEGGVSRKAIAQIVFQDPAELKWLEAKLHPKVRYLWEKAIDEAGNEDILIEIPLLFEKRLETAFDLTVCVSSPPEVVSERMIGRGYSKAEVEQRRLHQMPLSEKIQRADYVISNAGSIEFLEAQILRFNQQVHQS